MKITHLVEIHTPKRFVLNGLWFGPRKPKRVIVWVHGLGSSAFSMSHVVGKLVDKETAVLSFNNRGHDKISRLARVGEKRTGKTEWAGGACEVFTDCADDIQGAINFVRRQGVKNIFLAGHSTGCQKSIYWAAKGGKGVKGIILLAPVSDWAAEMKRSGKKKVLKAVAAARTLVKKGKKHELLPSDLWHEALDAQRMLSLYTPESIEEIFPYSLPLKKPTTLQKVNTPLLVLWAEKDEFADKPAREIASWFDTNIRAPHSVVVTPKVEHGFKGGEKAVAGVIRAWIKSIERGIVP